LSAAERLAGRFLEATGQEPETLWSAPGRVNLIGEHTDYNDGFVFPFAIDLHVSVAARRRDDGRIVCRSEQAPDEPGDALLSALDPASPASGWLAYPFGVLWSLTRHSRIGGLDLVIDGDVPLGSGLASSAALECAVVCAAAELYDLALTPVELALAGTMAENEYVGVPTGVMDQIAVMLCAVGHALFVDARTLAFQQVRLDPGADGCVLLLVDTGVRHTLAASAYADRRRSCERTAEQLGVKALRDVDDPSQLSRHARHVVTENARVLETVGLLEQRRLRDVGPVLTASHESLRDDFEVSSPELDAIVRAVTSAGALGARMVGGGFGGSVLVLADLDAEEDVRGAVADRGVRRVAPGPGVSRLRDY
jgi:galactokinase